MYAFNFRLQVNNYFNASKLLKDHISGGLMFKKLIITLIIITSTLIANGNSGIYGVGGISLGNAKGAETNYLEHTISNGDTIHTDKLEPSSIPFPILAVGYEKSLLKILSFRLGIGFERVGNEFKIKDGLKTSATASLDTLYTWEHKRSFSFSYLTIPLDLKLKLPLNRAGLYTVAGAKLGFLLSAKEKLEHTVTVINQSPTSLPYDLQLTSNSYEKNIKNDASAINMSLGFRLGGEIPVRRLHLLLESGYDFGLIEIMKKEKLVNKSGILTILSVGLRLNTTSDE